jgi:hypothetical protein
MNSPNARNLLQGIDSMIHVLVLANDSVLADIIVSTLSKEIDIDVVRMRYEELKRGDRYSVVILVDEEESEFAPFSFTDIFREGLTLLLIRVSIRSRNIFVYESYQINNPSMERVVGLVTDFGRAHLKKKAEERVKIRVAQTLRLMDMENLWRPN